MTTLYAMSDELRAITTALEEWAQENDGDITGFPWAQQLDTLRGSVEEKILSIAAYWKSLEAYAQTIRDEEKILAARRIRIESKANRLKGYALANFPAHLKKISGPQAEVTYSPGKPSVVLMSTADRLPDVFRKIEYVANKKALSEAMDEDGVVVVQGLGAVARTESHPYITIK